MEAPVHLKAGDGVVYANMILHWASNYSAKMRRCIHLGDRGFGSQLFYPNGFVDHENITRYLAPEKRARYARLLELYREENDLIETTLRTLITGDESGFRQGLARLHPGPEGRFTCLIQLGKIAGRMQQGTEERQRPRFTSAEYGLCASALHPWTRRCWQRAKTTCPASSSAARCPTGSTSCPPTSMSIPL